MKMDSSRNGMEEDDKGVEDMISLSDLNEHSILKNLKSRYSNELIYTYTGSILVAVNPYKMFNIYGLDMVKRYEGQPLGDLAPHLFAVGSASYTKMIKDTENQVLVISGESGAGKTESTKLIMQYLAAVNKSGNNLITEQILEANPLLESFGNAKTIRNDNSSRFGKYIEVYFKSGAIVGAKTSEYLLEKSRIVTQAPEERNYHVFYEMLEALTDEQKSKYGLQTAPKYFYLNQGGSSLIPGRDDAANYRKLTDAMEILSFERLEQETIVKILASVLHIGNIYFKSVHENNHDTIELGSEAEIKWISHLLELSDDGLKQSLTSKITEARGERVVSPYNLDQALDARDAIAKALYSRLFSWLVERVNDIICRSEREKSTSLAVLDIFGFEDFHLNSFEQLCINYANENLQYFFNQHVFRLEQREYNKEKIQWEHIEFKDNQPTIDLIATKPAGILHILDDESNFPKATDKSFLEKCHFHHSGNELYDKPRMSDPEFFVAHYAGKIKYNVQHFLEKNKDTLRSDVVELLCESKNEMISQMFQDQQNRSITKTLSKTTGRYVTLKPRTPTVAASFNESLLSLIDTMSRCNPYFVRCIKPNATKSPMVFEDIVVLDQLRYTGMLETIRIRRMGYPVRIKFPHFIERYRCLLRGQKIKNSQVPWDVCKIILQTQGPDLREEYQIGATKQKMQSHATLIRVEGDDDVILEGPCTRIKVRSSSVGTRIPRRNSDGVTATSVNSSLDMDRCFPRSNKEKYDLQKQQQQQKQQRNQRQQVPEMNDDRRQIAFTRLPPLKTTTRILSPLFVRRKERSPNTQFRDASHPHENGTRQMSPESPSPTTGLSHRQRKHEDDELNEGKLYSCSDRSMARNSYDVNALKNEGKTHLLESKCENCSKELRMKDRQISQYDNISDADNMYGIENFTFDAEEDDVFVDDYDEHFTRNTNVRSARRSRESSKSRRSQTRSVDSAYAMPKTNQRKASRDRHISINSPMYPMYGFEHQKSDNMVGDLSPEQLTPANNQFKRNSATTDYSMNLISSPSVAPLKLNNVSTMNPASPLNMTIPYCNLTNTLGSLPTNFNPLSLGLLPPPYYNYPPNLFPENQSFAMPLISQFNTQIPQHFSTQQVSTQTNNLINHHTSPTQSQNVSQGNTVKDAIQAIETGTIVSDTSTNDATSSTNRLNDATRLCTENARVDNSKDDTTQSSQYNESTKITHENTESNMPHTPDYGSNDNLQKSSSVEVNSPTVSNANEHNLSDNANVDGPGHQENSTNIIQSPQTITTHYLLDTELSQTSIITTSQNLQSASLKFKGDKLVIDNHPTQSASTLPSPSIDYTSPPSSPCDNISNNNTPSQHTTQPLSSDNKDYDVDSSNTSLVFYRGHPQLLESISEIGDPDKHDAKTPMYQTNMTPNALPYSTFIKSGTKSVDDNFSVVSGIRSDASTVFPSASVRDIPGIETSRFIYYTGLGRYTTSTKPDTHLALIQSHRHHKKPKGKKGNKNQISKARSYCGDMAEYHEYSCRSMSPCYQNIRYPLTSLSKPSTLSRFFSKLNLGKKRPSSSFDYLSSNRSVHSEYAYSPSMPHYHRHQLYDLGSSRQDTHNDPSRMFDKEMTEEQNFYMYNLDGWNNFASYTSGTKAPTVYSNHTVMYCTSIEYDYDQNVRFGDLFEKYKPLIDKITSSVYYGEENRPIGRNDVPSDRHQHTASISTSLQNIANTHSVSSSLLGDGTCCFDSAFHTPHSTCEHEMVSSTSEIVFDPFVKVDTEDCLSSEVLTSEEENRTNVRDNPLPALKPDENVKTKVFMKENFEMQLDLEARRIQSRAVIRLQTFIRMFLVYRRHQAMKQSTLRIQRMIRMRKARLNFKAVRNGIVRLQAQFRMQSQHKKYLKIREEIRRKLEEEKLARKKREAQERLEKEKRPGRMITRRISQLLFLDLPPDYDDDTVVSKYSSHAPDENAMAKLPPPSILKNSKSVSSHHRRQREPPEKQAQMMATVANLDIPRELAYVFSKTGEWELQHNGKHIITAMGDVIPMDMGYKLPADINSHAFSKYTSVYFKNPMWGVTMEPITTTLTPVQGDENMAQAVSVFKMILRFMCDNTMTEKRQKILSDFIVNMGLKNEAIRDEILCQLVNQTWLAQSKEKTDKVWMLIIACLCCFNPSPTLFKYLLKFASDVGLEGHNITAQHKVLQSAYMDPKLSRIYPGTYLEWKAAQKKANMALEVTFPDGVNVIGHVESWTSGELFTSHLLKLRGLNENSQGWTLMLQEDVDFYELMGYDYVLDLISEIEVPPGFPACSAYFLVSIDRTKERLHHRHHFVHADSVHNPEKDRIIVLTGPLPEMIKRDASKTSTSGLTPAQLYHQQQHNKGSNRLLHLMNVEDVGFSKTSVLNQRPTEILPSTLSENTKMNLRYMKRSRAPGPPTTNGHVPNGIANGHITTINEDDEDLMDNMSQLSSNRLNGRYFPNGDVKNVGDGTDLSHSKLNSRYIKNPKGNRHRQLSREDGLSVHSDMSQQVDDIFNNALRFHDEQDGRVLGSRIKGGGQGVPGIQSPQQPLTQPLNLMGLPGLQQPVVPPLNLNGISSPLSPTGLPDPLQQVAAQQMAQQQAILQAYLSQQQQQQQQQQQSALLQASLQQQQQQQAVLQNSQQQTVALKNALQQQELQNKLLKQSIEQEVLRQQLQQVQLQQHMQGQTVAPSLPINSPLTPESSFSSGVNMMGLNSSYIGSAGTSNAPLVNGNVNGDIPTPPVPEAPSGPRRVKFMKSAFETNRRSSGDHSPMSPPVMSPRHKPILNASAHVTKSITITSTTTADVPSSSMAPQAPPAPPPPPPLSFADPPSLHTQPLVPPTPPPAPPPPPPVNLDIDKERGTFTIRDKSGRARTIRIGKVVWPPPADKEEKEKEKKKREIRVGKLEIDEQVASEIESGLSGGGVNKPKNKIISTKKEVKLPSPTTEEPEDKSGRFRRTKSLVETYHIHTLRILEQKLGGSGSSQQSSETKVEQATPVPVVVPVSVHENHYSTRIENDAPPPLPVTPAPKLPTTTKTVTMSETVETVETRRSSGLYSTRIEADEVDGKLDRSSGDYSSRIELDIPALPAPTEPKLQIDYAAFERIITELYPQNKSFFLMYNKVPWTLHLRKEVFWPSEKLDNPTTVHLVYCQVVSDVYNNGCIRISRDQRVKMKSMLEGYGVDPSNYLTKEIKPQIKKVIVDTAKEWPIYFSRLFPIAANGHFSNVSHLGVSHTGLRLVTREKSIVEDKLNVMEEIRFEDVIDVIIPSDSCLQLNLRTKSIIFHTTRAHQLKDMIDRFCAESEKGNKFVVAIKDYITRESTLLSFKRGDIIKLMDPEMNLETGWLYGSLNGIVGLFPGEHVKPLARHEVETSQSKPVLYQPRPAAPSRQESHGPDDLSETSQGTVVADGKFSMMEYAMLHFRESLEKYEMLRTEDGSIRGTVKMIESVKIQNMKSKDMARRGADWSWKEQAELVKWTRSPIQASLLKLNSAELNKVALECFISIMRFMGDYPMGTNMNDFDCARKILLSCHNYPHLRDEVFCQLCKQTTNNRSMFHKSKIRGWRLFALVAAYYDCSDVLRPYLFKYLETTASDAGRTYNAAAALCLHNLRKTFKYGGRKDVPLKEEVVALADGRNCKRIPYYYPGVTEHGGILQVKSCTVVQDAIEDICRDLNISDHVEMDEYTLFVRSGEGAFRKLKREDYVLDIAAKYVRRQQQFDFIYQRTVWYFPIKTTDNDIYIDMFFHQVILDYIEGFLLVMPGGRLTNQTLDDVARLGALLFKANNFRGVPTLKDLASILPGNLRMSADNRQQQWLNRIHDSLAHMGPMSSIMAKAQFVEILKKWPLFGSTFFKIRRIPNVSGESLLAINKEGISFVSQDTQETIMHHSFSEILSTRCYCSDSNVNYLDMKLGNLMVQQILRIETDQGADISDLIGQYLQVINKHHKRQARLALNGNHYNT